MRALKIALVASEVAPFAKTGGLADVSAALGRALHLAGHDVRVILPLYGKLRDSGLEFERVTEGRPRTLRFPAGTYDYGWATAPLPSSTRLDGKALLVEFLDCPELFDRTGYYTSDPDEALRWTALSRGAIEAFQYTGWSPDIVHCNDWHTGLLPLLLKRGFAWDQLFAETRTLLTIHNIGYQGDFDAQTLKQLGLEPARADFDQDRLDRGRINFLETGVQHADWISTVSETYALEIQTDEHGMGLDGHLRRRTERLVGIVNGVDYGEWSPDSDALLPHAFSAVEMAGKERMREALLERLELPVRTDSGAERRPLVIGIVSRLAGQKGFELLPDVLPVFLQRDSIQLVLLGSGEERYERYFDWLQSNYPRQVAVRLTYDNELAHWIEAGSDLFLMPSRYEPCGLNQMYSQRYGTVPLVRHTGGLADTVVRWDPATTEGTGFSFHEFTPEALYHTLNHALEVWREPADWAKLVQNGMAQDFSWTRQSSPLRRALRADAGPEHLNMHVLFVEPSFPRNQREFVRALKAVGATVTGIGEAPVAALDSELKGWLDHYERVSSVTNTEALHQVVQEIQARGWVDRLESTVEAHTMPVAHVREACSIPGTSTRTAWLCRDKPAMKDALREVGIATAQSTGTSSLEEAREFVTRVGFPLIVKPRDGAGASGTYRANDDAEFEAALVACGVPDGASIAIEEFIEGHEAFWEHAGREW